MVIAEVKNVTKDFAQFRALHDVSFDVEEFSTVGLVGESGSGKTTLAKIILKLIPATSGEVVFNAERIRDFHKDVQIIFQNPYASLSPKMRVRDLVAEPLIIHNIVPRKDAYGRVLELLGQVGLAEDALVRFPREFSGGQRQRICIARALASEPRFLVLDEPISSLDLTVQAQMLDLFLALKERFKLTYIFISHNLAVVKYIASEVFVMQEGKIVESGECRTVFTSPRDPYTQQLLDAARDSRRRDTA